MNFQKMLGDKDFKELCQEFKSSRSNTSELFKKLDYKTFGKN